jgi:hypothetical protein
VGLAGVVDKGLFVRLAAVPLGVRVDSGGRAEGPVVGLEFVEPVRRCVSHVVGDGVVGEGPDTGDVDADEPHRVGRVALVVGAHPPDDVEDLLGPEWKPGVCKQRPWVAPACAQVIVDLDALGPVLLHGERAEPHFLDQEPQDPVHQGAQLVSAAG